MVSDKIKQVMKEKGVKVNQLAEYCTKTIQTSTHEKSNHLPVVSHSRSDIIRQRHQGNRLHHRP